MNPHEEAMRRLAHSMTRTIAFLGWDQQRIATKIGISRPMLSHLLHGKRRITYEHLIALCKALFQAHDEAMKAIFQAYDEAMKAQEIPTENDALLQAEHLGFFARLHEKLEWVGQEMQAMQSALQQE